MYRISLVRLPPDDGVVTRAQNRVDATNPVRFHIEVTSHRKKSLSFTKIFSCDLNVAGGRRKLLGAPGQLDLAASFRAALLGQSWYLAGQNFRGARRGQDASSLPSLFPHPPLLPACGGRGGWGRKVGRG